LFGLYSVVAWLYNQLPTAQRLVIITWPGTSAVTFSDALTTVRRWIWSEGVLSLAGSNDAIEKLPPPLREALFTALAPAA
jgi:hypothetical protein